MALMNSVLGNPALLIVVTAVLYRTSLRLHGRYSWAHSLLFSSVALVILLHAFRVPYDRYRIGGDAFSYLLGPATVALAVPMYKQALRMRGSLKQLLLVVLAGSIVGMLSAGSTAWLLGAPRQVIMSTLPKSVTT